jgi:hypothetical protein
MIGSLPQVHELAEQAGIDLPDVLGRIRSDEKIVQPAEETPEVATEEPQTPTE